MTNTPNIEAYPGADRDVDLAAIVRAVKGNFQTVEDMTQSFIREAILRGTYRPGERLNQDAIAAALGVSRMPVRASLRQLEAEGLLKIHPHRGATVSVLRPNEIAEIYELRVLLECYLLGHAMANLNEDRLTELTELLADLEDEHSLPQLLERRKAFYERLYSFADRPRALILANQLRASVGRYLLLQRVDEHVGHGGLLPHLVSGDVASAKRWLTAHLSGVSRELQRLVAASDAAVG